MPCDRTFGVVKRAVRQYDRIDSSEEYISIICNAKKTLPSYEVVAVQNEDITDFQTWWPLHFTKTPGSVGNRSEKFSISKYRYIIYNSETKGYVQAYEYIQGLVYATFRLAKTNEVSLPSGKAYGGKVPIMKKKLDDVSKVTQYIPERYREFYEDRLSWPTGNNSDNEDD